MGDWWFEQEYLCQFREAQTQLFTREDTRMHTTPTRAKNTRTRAKNTRAPIPTILCAPQAPFFGTSTYVASLAHADVVWLVHSDAA
jgi:hypothetical protein